MKTILVIDDMAIFREPIAAGLALAGFKTIKAADGLSGLNSVRANRPDLVLLDLSMPNLDGLGVLRAVRRDPIVKNTPVILLTALTDLKFVDEAAKLGVQRYLLKSRFSIADLVLQAKAALEDAEETEPCPAKFEAPTVVYPEDKDAEIVAV